MLAAMDIQNSQESSGHLDECFTLLSRACYAPENVEYIAACGGAETIIDTLKGIDVGESGLAKRGGKLLWKLAKGKVKDAIKKLDQGQDPKAIDRGRGRSDVEGRRGGAQGPREIKHNSTSSEHTPQLQNVRALR